MFLPISQNSITQMNNFVQIAVKNSCHTQLTAYVMKFIMLHAILYAYCIVICMLLKTRCIINDTGTYLNHVL